MIMALLTPQKTAREANIIANNCDTPTISIVGKSGIIYPLLPNEIAFLTPQSAATAVRMSKPTAVAVVVSKAKPVKSILLSFI